MTVLVAVSVIGFDLVGGHFGIRGKVERDAAVFGVVRERGEAHAVGLVSDGDPGHDLEFLEVQDGDVVAIMSNGGFGAIHDKMLGSLREKNA